MIADPTWPGSRLRRRSSVVSVSLVLMLLFTLLVTACGDSDDSSSDSAAGGGDAGGGASVVEAAQADVDEHLAAITEGPEPEPGPKPRAGQTIYVISCGQAAEGCRRATDGAAQAAKTIGWKAEVVDGAADPAKMTAGVRAAIQQGADGIVLIFIDEKLITPALRDAEEAEIPVVVVEGGYEPRPGGVDADVGGEEFLELGRAIGNYVIADTDGEGNVIVLEDTSFRLTPTEGVLEALEACQSCEIVAQDNFQVGDLGGALTERVRTLLTRNPDVDWIVVPYDAAAIPVVQGVKVAGKAGKVKVASQGANDPNLDLVRNGEVQHLTAGQPLEWVSFAAVDQLNRIIQGAEQADYGEFPFQLLTEENVPPAGERWDVDFDYVGSYEALWGDN